MVLIPGYGGASGGLELLAERLRTTGRSATVVRLPEDGTGDLREQAAAVEEYVEQALDTGATSVDLVAHSAGGVVARVWLRERDGVGKARRIVTLGSPHHGASLAAAGAALLPGACPIACQQLVPGSALLAELTTPMPNPPMWLSLWTTEDEVVTPPESAILDGALSVAIQSVCPGATVGHAELPTDPTMVALVLTALGRAELTIQDTCPGP